MSERNARLTFGWCIAPRNDCTKCPGHEVVDDTRYTCICMCHGDEEIERQLPAGGEHEGA